MGFLKSTVFGLLAASALGVLGLLFQANVEFTLNIGDFVLGGLLAGLIPTVRKMGIDISELKNALTNAKAPSSDRSSRQRRERARAEWIARSLRNLDENVEITWTPPAESSIHVNEPWQMHIKTDNGQITVEISPLELAQLPMNRDTQNRFLENINEKLRSISS